MEGKQEGYLVLKHDTNYDISNVIIRLLKLKEKGYTHVNTYTKTTLIGIADLERSLIDVKHG